MDKVQKVFPCVRCVTLSAEPADGPNRHARATYMVMINLHIALTESPLIHTFTLTFTTVHHVFYRLLDVGGLTPPCTFDAL
jgi:hypothetical protein